MPFIHLFIFDTLKHYRGRSRDFVRLTRLPLNASTTIITNEPTPKTLHRRDTSVRTISPITAALPQTIENEHIAY